LELEKTNYDPDNISNAKQYIIQPHPIQFLCLFRLIESNCNQLIEILTGEGKSVILGIGAIYYALTGYEVTCTSYSEYLSERDYADFEKLFKYFNIDSMVSYLPITGLCERMINHSGNIRLLTKNILEGKQIDSANVSDQINISKKQLLFIDEVDVFFGVDFYGETYNPATIYTDDNTYNLLKYIWENRSLSLSVNNISNVSYFKELVKKFPTWERLLKGEISKMLLDLKEFSNPPYKVLNDKICYKNQDSYSNVIFHRYKTTFAYFHELNFNNISSDAVVRECSGLLLNCGSFSFAEIPKQFDLILGVTGTLSDFSEIEKKIIEGYNINTLAFAPSVYGQSRRSFDGVRTFQHKTDWFLHVLQMAKTKTDLGRAVIIFFDNFEILQEFLTQHGNSLPRIPNILHEAEEFKDTIVRKASATGEVTLCTRPFGRGVDFVCRDDITLEKGGVHVILTFPTYSQAEEIQIQGRAARQGELGSWEIAWWVDDLQHLSITWEQMEQHKPDQLSFVKHLRDKKLQESVALLLEKAVKAKVVDEESAHYRKLLADPAKNANEIITF